MVKPSQQPPKNRLGKKRQQTQTLSSEARAARLSEIKELIKIDRLDEAFVALKPILAERPNNLRAKLMLATLLQKKRDFSAAIEVYEAIISLDRQKIAAYLELAECLTQLGKTKEAIAILEEGLGFCPKDLQLLQALGDLSRQIPNRQALDYYRQILTIAPDNLQANLALAAELRDSGLFTAAEQQLQTAEKYHQDLTILLEFAQLEKKRHQLERAWDYLQQASKSYPENIEPRLAAIEILWGLGRIAESRQILEQLQKQEPHPSIPLYFGHLEKKQGRREKALEWFQLAVAKSPNLTRKLRAQTLVIEELKELRRFESAIATVDSLIREFPHRIDFKLIEGSILQKKLAFSSAAQLYCQILETKPDCIEALIELAKTYSCLGQVKKAVKLLQETEQLQDSYVRVLMLLGALARASEDWETASNYYQEACNLEPYNINSHCALANLRFLQGEIDSANDLLKTAQVRMPYALKIALKQSELHLRWGDLDFSYDCLAKMRQLFPDRIPLLWQLCRVYSAMGNYEAAEKVLAEVVTDERDAIAETEKLRADIAFHQYDYLKAEARFQQAIANSDVPTVERTKLASVLMLTYRIDPAREQLKLATTEYSLKTPTGKSIVPLKSHSAMVINALRINPPLREQLEATQQLTKSDRLIALAKIISQEPFYLGGCLYLAKELRYQGIFARIRDSLAADNNPSIPQRIVQFWDEPEPPESVQRICQSWRDRNPDYEYIRFSLPTALKFLQQHYDDRVLQAFDRCYQPATQADFFRLAYLNQMGGFYADVDDLCRASLNSYNQLNPELVVLQEDLACFGNNFLGCVPNQPMIRIAFERAIDNLLEYYNDSPWFDTGPGLLTCAVMNGLLPYLTAEVKRYPRLWVLTQPELKAVVVSHISLPYKRTAKGWHYDTYRRWIELGEQPDSNFAE